MVKRVSFVNEAGVKVAPIKVKLERTTTEKYRWGITVLGNYENEVLKIIDDLNKRLLSKYANRRNKMIKRKKELPYKKTPKKCLDCKKCWIKYKKYTAKAIKTMCVVHPRCEFEKAKHPFEDIRRK